MPYVNMKVTPEGVTSAKKEELIAGVTRLLFDTLGKDPDSTFVVLDVVETEDWGWGGESVQTRRAKRGVR